MKLNLRLLFFTGMLVVPRAYGFGPIVLTTEPSDQVVNQGFETTFSVVATGRFSYEYQWSFNAREIAGATNRVLTITNTQPAHQGSYLVVVTGAQGSATSRVASLTVKLPVALDPKLGPNIRLGADSPLLLGRSQGEIHIARSFQDPNSIVATFQDGIGSTHPGAAPASYLVSADGGLTWRGDFIPIRTAASGDKIVAAGDNVAAFDGQGNVYIASLTGLGTPIYYMLLNKSVDSGQTFGPVMEAARGTPSDWADKEWLAVNTFPDSPHPNRIALAYDRGELSLRGYSIYSDDGGLTWSQPKSIGGLALGMQNFFLPDGSLGVLYWKFLTDAFASGPQRVEMVLSKDGGTTFAPSTVVMDAKNFENPVTKTFAARFFPCACTDRQAGVIYVAVGAETGAATNRASRILFTKSIDQGKTWSAPLQVNDTRPGKTACLPAIAASPDGQHVTIEFYDERNDTGEGYLVDLYLAESFDGGDTWGPNLRLSEFSSDIRSAPMEAGFPLYFLGDYQAMVPSLNFETPAVAAWIDTRAGNADPYSVRIARTQGTSFEAWRKLRFSSQDLANPVLSSETGDPDGDGIPNLAEYALGLEPNKAEVSPVQVFTSSQDSSPRLTASFECLAVLGDISHSWQVSTNLVNWSPIAPEQETIAVGSNPWMQRIQSTFSLGGPRRFFRLSFARRI